MNAQTVEVETTVDEELAALARIVNALGDLDDEARARVIRWANDRFFPVLGYVRPQN